MSIDMYSIAMSPPCRAVIMVAEHLGIELNLKNVDLFAGEQYKAEYLKLNPLHTVPTIDDNGFILYESHAILTYLVNQYSPNNPIYPEDPKKRAVIDRMLYFDIGTLFSSEREALVPIFLKGENPDPEKLESLHKVLKSLDEMLEKTAYAAGDHITLADFSIVASLSLVEIVDMSFEKYPKLTAYVKKMKEEIPNYEKINGIPIQELKEEYKSGALKQRVKQLLELRKQK